MCFGFFYVVALFAKHFANLCQNLLGLSTNGVIMIAVGDGHKLGRLAVTQALHEIINVSLCEQVELDRDLTVQLVTNKNVNDRSAKRYDRGQLVLGLRGVMAHLEDSLSVGSFLDQITAVCRKDFKARGLENRDVLHNDLSGNRKFVG